jgi:molecular chaperone GrpE
MAGKSKIKMKKNRTEEEEMQEIAQDEEQKVYEENESIHVEILDSEGDSADSAAKASREETHTDPAQEVDKLRQALSDSDDKYLRLQAEFQNFRKRKERELGEAIRFANADLLLKLLPILDNFERTLDAIDKTDNLAAIKEGISLVDQSMKKQFEKVGLKPIESVGKVFNVELHEAITAVSVDDEGKKGKVIDEVEKGYMLKDKVLRFSKVVVGE